eukprot:scaffold35932_cov50-Attheya_sp.AAC.1
MVWYRSSVGGVASGHRLTVLVMLMSTLSSTVAFSGVGQGFARPSTARASASSTVRLAVVRPTPEDADGTNVNVAVSTNNMKRNHPLLALTVACSLSAGVLMTGGGANNIAHAYDESDYASETVTASVQKLKDAAGNPASTFSIFEEIAAIITEGKGVGGSVSYTGVNLERGYVSDEDTSIYNPGLTLLTESEKERLVSAVIDNRKVGLKQNQWPENNEFAYDFLKTKLDPLHMVEVRGYLGVLPFYAAVVYGATFAAQQILDRELFPFAYAVAAVSVFFPIFALVAAGPQ